MSSTFGKLFRISTWGESHGPALGVVIDGCPAGLPIGETMIQNWLDRRRPGQNKLVTQRKESDTVEILSGIFEGKSTGTPISLLIRNRDQRSADYDEMAEKMTGIYRPSHADLSYDLKYGFRDHRGGGRSSARETAARVAAGAIAASLLQKCSNTEILSFVDEIAGISCTTDPLLVSDEQVESSPVRCPNAEISTRMEDAIVAARKDQDSVGGIIRLVVKNPPVGIGEPVFDRVEAELAKAMLSIPATKGFESGSGFAGSRMRGSKHNDPIRFKNGHFCTTKNDAGGTLGGITNGEPLLCRIAFKPTATLSKEQQTVDNNGESATLSARGRHDPCVVPRAPIIVSAMAALVLADLYLQQRARQGIA